MSALRITAIGDMMFDREVRPPRLLSYQPDAVECHAGFAAHFRVPFVNGDESLAWLRRRNQSVYGAGATSHASVSRTWALPPEAADAGYPFAAVLEAFAESDLVVGNLECPLSDRGRPWKNDACYRASPMYAEGMRGASVKVASLANNHVMDYGETALFDTLEALRTAGVQAVGAGRTLDEARAPAIVEEGGQRVAFLSYSMIGDDVIFAIPGQSGVAPLNPMIAAQDIALARASADCTIVSVHWGEESQPMPVPRLIELAHFLVESGADAVLGHHPHVPGSIEIHRGRPIFYSLGNFSFGHTHSWWTDNVFVQLHRDGDRWTRLTLHAISGGFQPRLLDGPEADAVYERVMRLSAPFGTKFELGAGGPAVIAAS